LTSHRIWILCSDHLIWYIYYLRFEKRFCSYVMWMIYMKIRSEKCSLARISVHFPFITNSRTVWKGFYCTQRSQTRATCCWPCCYKCHEQSRLLHIYFQQQTCLKFNDQYFSPRFFSCFTFVFCRNTLNSF